LASPPKKILGCGSPITVTQGKNITAYYRIQGPKLVIEYAPQRLGGDPSTHIHTMYRDPTNDGVISETDRRAE
jgi:hypothetical protein